MISSNVEDVVKKFLRVFYKRNMILNHDLDVLPVVIDDSRHDGSFETVKSLNCRYGRLEVIWNLRNSWLSASNVSWIVLKLQNYAQADMS